MSAAEIAAEIARIHADIASARTALADTHAACLLAVATDDCTCGDCRSLGCDPECSHCN